MAEPRPETWEFPVHFDMRAVKSLVIAPDGDGSVKVANRTYNPISPMETESWMRTTAYVESLAGRPKIQREDVKPSDISEGEGEITLTYNTDIRGNLTPVKMAVGVIVKQTKAIGVVDPPQVRGMRREIRGFQDALSRGENTALPFAVGTVNGRIVHFRGIVEASGPAGAGSWWKDPKYAPKGEPAKAKKEAEIRRDPGKIRRDLAVTDIQAARIKRTVVVKDAPRVASEAYTVPASRQSVVAF